MSQTKQSENDDSATDYHPPSDLTAFKQNILTVLSGLGSPKGLAIKRELEDYYGQEVNHGRLYPNLDDLVELDLVKKGEKDKRTNSYTLTMKGKRTLDAHREWENQYLQN